MNCRVFFAVFLLAAWRIGCAFAAPSSPRSVVSTVAPINLSAGSIHFNGTLALPSGKPASGALVTVDVVDLSTRQILSSRTFTSDAKGGYAGDIFLDLSKNCFPVAYAAKSKYSAPLSLNYAGHQTVLLPPTTVRVHIVGGDGKPVVNTIVYPSYLIPLSGNALIPAPWSDIVDSRWSGVTDSTGAITLKNLPQNYTVVLHVDDDHYIQPDFNTNTFALAASTVTPDQTVKLPLGASISGTVIDADTGQPAADVHLGLVPASHQKAEGDPLLISTDTNGHFTIAAAKPGDYCLEYVDGPGGSRDWTTVAMAVDVLPGQSVENIVIRLIHGALITGTVTDTSSGRPMNQMLLWSNGPDHPLTYSSTNLALSDSVGNYFIRVAPGEQAVTFHQPNAADTSQHVYVLAGTTTTMNFSGNDGKSPILAEGFVLGTDGKPAAGAGVFAVNLPYSCKVTADNDGHFKFPAPGLPQGALLYASLGATAAPNAISVRSNAILSLHLSPNNGLAIAGTVKGSNGKPVQSASVELFREMADGSGVGVDSTQTDILGKYRFPLEYGQSLYSVSATSQHYTQAGSLQFSGEYIHSYNVPTLVISAADSYVAGKLVSSTGQPISGAHIYVDSVWSISAVTDSAGRFNIKGVPDGVVLLRVIVPNCRQVTVKTSAGKTDNVIVLRPMLVRIH